MHVKASQLHCAPARLNLLVVQAIEVAGDQLFSRSDAARGGKPLDSTTPQVTAACRLFTVLFVRSYRPLLALFPATMDDPLKGLWRYFALTWSGPGSSAGTQLGGLRSR